jgi:GAF domain-containing protein
MILTRKLITPTVILFIILLAGLFAYFFSSLHDATHKAEEGDLASFSDSFSAEMENQKQLALALASDAAGNPAIQKAFAEGDRQALGALTLPSYQLLKENNGNIILYQYYLADGTLFYNANDPSAATHEITSSPAVLLANSSQTPVAGLEAENGALGIRGIVPVYYQGVHIGAVEFGIGFNRTLLVNLKEKYGGEWQILLNKDILPEANAAAASPNTDLLVFATTQVNPLYNSSSSYISALNGETPITHPSEDGRDYAILSAPLYDYSENIIGVLDIVYDHTHISSAQNTRLIFAGLASIGALTLGILGLVFLTRRTLQPIQTLTRTAAEIAEGNMTSYAVVEASNDEIGVLANAFNRMTNQIRTSIVGLEQRVADRTRDLEDQTLRFRVAAEIARDSTSARDLGTLLERSAQLIFDRFHYYHVGIFIVDKNNEVATLTAAPTEAGKNMIANNYKIRVGEIGPIGRVAATGEPRVTLDTRLETVAPTNPFLPDTRSEMVMPLKAENKVIGILDIQSDQVQAFKQDDIAIMQVIADQLATAIERTRLLQEVGENLHELERAYGQYTREGWQRLRSSGRMKNKGYRFDNIRIEPIQQISTVGNEALEKGTTVNSNGSNDSHEIAIPIKLRGQTVGVVNAKLREGYNETTVSTLELAIERLASALESARLYEEASVRADREQAISQITSAISSSSDYEMILRTTVREIGSVLTDTEVSIQILGEEKN